jgi:hypothetical protein
VTEGSATVARVPCVRRATACVVVIGVAAMVAGACGGDRKVTGFCGAIERGHAGFDSTDPHRSAAALAQLDRVIAAAPPTVAPDLKTMSSTLTRLYRNPKAVVADPSILDRYWSAVDHIDEYLRDECGLRIPRRKV